MGSICLWFQNADVACDTLLRKCKAKEYQERNSPWKCSKKQLKIFLLEIIVQIRAK